MSSGTIIGAAIGALVVGIAIGFFIPTDEGIQEVSQTIVQQEQVGYDIDKLTIGFIPSEKADELTPNAESLARFLESGFDGEVDVDIVVPTNYEIILEGIRFGHIDAAFMDTGPGWLAEQRAGGEVVMAEVKKGKVGYYATVWQHVDSNFSSIDEAVGKKVAFTSITGSSGFVRPMGTLVDRGLVTVEGDDIVALKQALDDSFEYHVFAGGYKAALELLLNGNVDIAFGSDIAPEKYLSSEQQKQLKKVDTLGLVPSHVFVVSDTLSDTTKQKLVDVLTKLNHQDNNQILKDVYGADALLSTTAEMHIGNFGQYLELLPGIDQATLDKKNYDAPK
jgi:phosphonate transport system substrate-binding protein